MKYLRLKTLKSDYAVVIDQLSELIKNETSLLLKMLALKCIKEICMRIPNQLIYQNFSSIRKTYLLCDYLFIFCCRILNEYEPEIKIKSLEIIVKNNILFLYILA